MPPPRDAGEGGADGAHGRKCVTNRKTGRSQPTPFGVLRKRKSALGPNTSFSSSASRTVLGTRDLRPRGRVVRAGLWFAACSRGGGHTLSFRSAAGLSVCDVCRAEGVSSNRTGDETEAQHPGPRSWTSAWHGARAWGTRPDMASVPHSQSTPDASPW